MTNFRSFNINDGEVWNHFNMIIRKNKRFYKKIRIRCVAFKTGNNDEYQNILCLIKAYTQEAMLKKIENKIYEYKNICLFEYWYNIDSFQLNNWINVEQKDKIILHYNDTYINSHPYGDIGIRLNQPLTFNGYSFESFDNDYSELSGYLYRSNNRLLDNINRFDFNEPILSYEKPLFLNTYQAIKEWIKLKEFHNDSDARMGTVVIFLPEGIAGFKSIETINGKLNITTRLSDNKLKPELKIKILWIISGQRKNLEYEFNNKIICDIPATAESVYIYLIGRDETVYDYYQETNYWTYGKRRIIGVVDNSNNGLQEIISEALKNGENETTEFKPFINYSNNKWDEIIKTVIAFSNTHGGNIIIGVSDNVYIGGIENGLNTEYQKCKKSQPNLPNEPVEWYKGLIKKIIGDKLSGNTRPNIDHLIYDNHTLIIIKVPEGQEKPYYNRETNDIYIRKGGSNAKPDPKTELPDLLKENLASQNNIFNLGYSMYK